MTQPIIIACDRADVLTCEMGHTILALACDSAAVPIVAGLTLDEAKCRDLAEQLLAAADRMSGHARRRHAVPSNN